MSNTFKSSKNNRFEMPDTNTNTNTDSETKSVSSLDRDTKENHRQEFRQRERTYDARPSFVFKSSKPTQKIYYEHNNQDFPDLVIVNSDLNKSGCTLDYKNASLKEEEKPDVVEIYEPGWLYMKFEKGRNHILKKIGPKINYSNKPVISVQQHLNKSMNNAIQIMEERRYQFIEAYGEDNYERDYRIDSYYEMAEDYEDDYYGEDQYLDYDYMTY
jgi:hypothetical protein